MCQKANNIIQNIKNQTQNKHSAWRKLKQIHIYIFLAGELDWTRFWTQAIRDFVWWLCSRACVYIIFVIKKNSIEIMWFCRWFGLLLLQHAFVFLNVYVIFWLSLSIFCVLILCLGFHRNNRATFHKMLGQFVRNPIAMKQNKRKKKENKTQ